MSLMDSLRALMKSGGPKRIDISARFERMRTSATGTMSSFFVARDLQHGNRIVGVKLLDVEKVELFEARFKGLNKPSEGEIALGMKHPNVVTTYEYGVTPKGQPVLVMEYIDGPSLQQVIVQKTEHLIAGKRLMLIRQMAEAIRYVHSKNYIHRDICPRNFICETDLQTLKLIDFGLSVPATAAFMAPGNRTGTPLYMSPEIVRRRATDKRVDIFSFGVTCYCLCALEQPWKGEEVSGKAALKHDTTAPIDIREFVKDMEPRLAKAIMQSIEPKLEARMPSMDQFLNNIAALRLEY